MTLVICWVERNETKKGDTRNKGAGGDCQRSRLQKDPEAEKALGSRTDRQAGESTAMTVNHGRYNDT